MTNPEEPLQLRLCGVAAESARASAIYASVAQLVSAASLAFELLSLWSFGLSTSVTLGMGC